MPALAVELGWGAGGVLLDSKEVPVTHKEGWSRGQKAFRGHVSFWCRPSDCWCYFLPHVAATLAARKSSIATGRSPAH